MTHGARHIRGARHADGATASDAKKGRHTDAPSQFTDDRDQNLMRTPA